MEDFDDKMRLDRVPVKISTRMDRDTGTPPLSVSTQIRELTQTRPRCILSPETYNKHTDLFVFLRELCVGFLPQTGR